MNDTHGVEDPASHFNCKLFRDPANRLSGRALDPRDPPNAHWVALNYARPAVREFMFAHIREYIDGYGFEGMELDWLRDPHVLEPGATEADCRILTDWLRQVRAYTEAKGRQRAASAAWHAPARQPRLPAQPRTRRRGHRPRRPGRLPQLLEFLADFVETSITPGCGPKSGRTS
jgi:hypothetical protein